MRTTSGIGIVILLAAVLACISPVAAQSPLEHLENGIRSSNGQPVATYTAPQKVYFGAVADDEAGRGVRVLSIRNGGPADRAGLQPQDLIVAVAGRKIHWLSELSVILNGLNPGDRLAVEILRGNRPVHTDVVVGAPLGVAAAAQPTLPAPSGLGAGHTESIPPPPGETIGSPPPPGEGPSLIVPGNPGNSGQPYPPKSGQAQIEELSRRVDQLERRVQELERELAESRRK